MAPIEEALVDDVMVRRLIERVKAEPCVYNSSHQLHDSKKAGGAEYQDRKWHEISADIGINDVNLARTQWKLVRETYLRERRKRKLDEKQSSPRRSLQDGASCSSASDASANSRNRLYEMMRWIEPYLADSGGNIHSNAHYNKYSNGKLPPQKSATSHQATLDQNGGIASGGRSVYYHNDSAGPSSNTRSVSSAANVAKATEKCGSYNSSSNFDVHNPRLAKVNVNVSQNEEFISGTSTNLSNGSTSHKMPRLRVIRSSSTDDARLTTQQRLQPVTVNSATMARNQSSQRVLIAKPDQPKSSTSSSVGSVYTIMTQASPSHKNVINAQITDGNAVAMVIDTTNYYQHGNQKMYRLVNVSEMSADSMSGNNLGSGPGEIKLIALSRNQSAVDASTRRKRFSPVSVSCVSNTSKGRAADSSVLEEDIGNAIGEKSNDRGSHVSGDLMLMDHSTGSSDPSGSLHQVSLQALGGSSHQHSQSSSQNAQTSSQINQTGIPVINTRQLQHQKFVSQADSSQQTQYTVLSGHSIQNTVEEYLELTNDISEYLCTLSDDEKAVAKLNIHRLVTNARFGRGACTRMIHDEEFNEISVDGTHQLLHHPHEDE